MLECCKSMSHQNPKCCNSCHKRIDSVDLGLRILLLRCMLHLIRIDLSEVYLNAIGLSAKDTTLALNK